MSTKSLTLAAGLFLLMAAWLAVEPAVAQVRQPAPSPYATVSEEVGLTDITVKYCRPGVNERTIWGDGALVPNGLSTPFPNFGSGNPFPWRGGANENTTISFENDMLIEGQKLAAGTYGLHMAIQENGEVIVIFSKNSTAWGSFFYDEKEDALRVTVKSEEASHRELLTFEFAEVSTNSATASLVWEKKKIPFKIEADVTGIVTANLKKELQSSPGFTYQNWNAAANFALNNDGDLEQALQWADASISAPFVGQKTFSNLSTKAQILAKMGKTEESKKVMDEALPMATILKFMDMEGNL